MHDKVRLKLNLEPKDTVLSSAVPKTLREQALPYVSYLLDDAQGARVIWTGKFEPADIPTNAVLVGWQCGFEPLFVAVQSYLPNTTLTQDEAVKIATDYLEEIGWFGDVNQEGRLINSVPEPDYIIGGTI